MVAKFKINKSLSATIEYNTREKSELIGNKNLYGETLNEQVAEMQHQQKAYKGWGKNTTSHAILSPSIEDGKRLDKEKWLKIADEYLKQMQLDKLQSMYFLHTDKGHKHLHIVTNRIDDRGKVFRTRNNELLRSHHIGNNIARSMGMVQASEIHKEREAKQKEETKATSITTGGQGLMDRIRQDLVFVFNQVLADKKKFDREEYFKRLEKEKGYEVVRHMDKDKPAELRGYSVKKEDFSFTATQVHRSLQLTNLAKNKPLKIEAEQKKILDVQKEHRPTMAAAVATITEKKQAERQHEQERHGRGLSM